MPGLRFMRHRNCRGTSASKESVFSLDNREQICYLCVYLIHYGHYDAWIKAIEWASRRPGGPLPPQAARAPATNKAKPVPGLARPAPKKPARLGGDDPETTLLRRQIIASGKPCRRSPKNSGKHCRQNHNSGQKFRAQSATSAYQQTTYR